MLVFLISQKQILFQGGIPRAVSASRPTSMIQTPINPLRSIETIFFGEMRGRCWSLFMVMLSMLLGIRKSFLLHHPQRDFGRARKRWSTSSPTSVASLLVGRKEHQQLHGGEEGIEHGGEEGIERQPTTPTNPTTTGARIFQGKTVANVMGESIQLLDQSDCDEPVESTVHLLASSLGLSWESGYRELLLLLQQQSTATTTTRKPSALSQRIVNEEEAKSFKNLLSRRCMQEPIQYILGQWDFMDYTLVIRPPLLCPRPETEELVELVLMDAATKKTRPRDVFGGNGRQHQQHQQLRILDIGCGTGCIGIALADKIHDSLVRSIDIDPVAISTTLENAKRILGDDDVDDAATRIDGQTRRFRAELVAVENFSPNQQFDIIVSNPPYIPSADMATLAGTVIDYESKTALHGGDDGLDVIRVILNGLPRWLVEGGSCWMEVDPTHPVLLEELVCTIPGLVFVKSVKDLTGKDRFVQVQRVVIEIP